MRPGWRQLGTTIDKGTQLGLLGTDAVVHGRRREQAARV
jgi:hypothetical protein